MYDIAFINGVVKSREKFLLGDKIERMLDCGKEDVIRLLRESGFGGEISADAQLDTEQLIRAEEERVNAFIREYAPDRRTLEFLLAEYDFHNAEAFIKCKYAGAEEDKILSATGAVEKATLKKAVADGDCEGVPKAILEAIKQTSLMFEEGTANGFNVDCVFKAAMFEYLSAQARDRKLKSILQAKADAVNVSIALRSRDWSVAENMIVKGGKLPESQIKAICELPFEDILKGDFSEQVKLAVREASRNAPLIEFEKKTDDYAVELLFLTRYDMKGVEPFVLYVLRRRAEIKNVRIITVSQTAGLSAQQIRNKIRLY